MEHTMTFHGTNPQAESAPAQPHGAQMPLALAAAGEENHVREIRGKDDTRRFLETLGFVEGAFVTVVSELGGNVIVNVKDTRVAISKAMANRIIVA